MRQHIINVIEKALNCGNIEYGYIKHKCLSCDEVSIVMAYTADGSVKTPTLFMAKEGISEDKPLRFGLKSANIMDD